MLSSFSFSDKTVGFLLEGDYTTELADELHEQILKKSSKYEKINLYLEDSGVESFSLNTIATEISFKLKNQSIFNKVALVSNRKWIHLCGAIENVFLDVEIKSFSTEDRLKAISWIAEED